LAIGKARQIFVQITDNQGKTQNVNINRDSSIALDDGTKIKFVEFESNFSLEKESLNKNLTKYQNPTAILEVISPDHTKQTVYALSEGISENKDFLQKTKDYSFKLVDFERVSEQNTLFIRYDPGIKIVYFGFALLLLTLSAVFLFSHQRIWCMLEDSTDNKTFLIISGNTNRNQLAFEDKYKKIIRQIGK
jgi:cytochrome c biogenesis protein ResB